MTSADQTFYGSDFGQLQSQDPEIAGVLLSELDRLRGGLQLIASENLTSPAVLAALGSTLSNKYAEGYPGRRYYGGCSEVDKAESIGIERAKRLFEADHANLQPHSGASANQAVYGAFCQPGDTILAMSLPHGGHLTHGTKVSFSGKWFNAVHYGVDKQTEDIDYDQVRELALQHRPKVIVAGGSAIPRLIDFAFFRALADEVGAIFWVDAAHFIGLVAGKAIPSPVPYADVVTFTTHKVLRGPRGGMFVCRAEHAAKMDKAVFPMMQGGPLMHSVAAKAVNLLECLQPEYQTYARQVIANAQQLADVAGGARHPPDHRRHRHPPLAARPAGRGGDRPRRRGPLRRGRHRPEQERHPVRPPAAEHRLGHPGRHAVGDHPGDGHPRDGDDRRADPPGRDADRRRPRPRGRQGDPGRGDRPRPALPGLPSGLTTSPHDITTQAERGA